jgi:hypothetical protein
MTNWTGYRQPRAAGGGGLNGYFAPRAKQQWDIGQIVNVGFVKGLVVKAKAASQGWALWQPATNRFYNFVPHMGLTRCDSFEQAAS